MGTGQGRSQFYSAPGTVFEGWHNLFIYSSWFRFLAADSRNIGFFTELVFSDLSCPDLRVVLAVPQNF